MASSALQFMIRNAGLRAGCILILFLALSACSEAPEESPTETPALEEPATPGEQFSDNYTRELAPWLTHDEARLRSQTISNVVYRLALNLTREETYSGEVVIEFDYKPSQFPLTLDFLGGTVRSIRVGPEVLPIFNTGKHISISSRFFSEGRNSIQIRYTNTYSEDGAGLYRFVDGTDGRVYLYTHFEPYDANRLVPSFDQPDLRASWQLTVRVPNDWQVISSVREERIEHAAEYADWHFPPSAKISSYIFPLHAGQYHVWESMAGNIPLRLFARESLAEHVRADWLLDITAKGMAYFREYFDEPYPFTKYDQLIVPDFNIGGMENVAAVTYTENYIPRGEPTRERLQAIASTFLHELSHMWFGDLVTIDWWNALWLKESFASIMDPMAIDGATDFEAAWLQFYLYDKQKAYTADQRVTTHPIEMPVRDTKSGDASFDRITYQKGASVLKQLNHLLGEETFREGVRQYMNKYAWKAAVLSNFMDTLSEVSGRDMQAWSRDWLETAGLNTVETQYQCEDDKITAFKLMQTAPEDYPTLRTHRMQTGLYQLVDGSIEQQRLVAVELNGAVTDVPELIGETCPLLVYPNAGDWAYIKVRLDDQSAQRVPENLNKIADPLLRSMFWYSLWDAVRDVQMPLADFLDIALAELPAETNSAILGDLLGIMIVSRSYLYRFGAGAGELRNQYLPALEEMARRGLMSAATGSDLQKQWFDAWLTLANTPVAMNDIDRWLEGAGEPLSLNQDQDRRWRAVIILSSLGYQRGDKLQEKEIARDPSDRGSELLVQAQAAWPDVDIKTSFLDKIDDIEGEATEAELKAGLYSMFRPGQEEQHGQLADRILQSLPQVDTNRHQDFVEDYVDYLLPGLCTNKSVERLADNIRDRGGLGLIATKALMVEHQEDQRCVEMAAKQAGGL